MAETFGLIAQLCPADANEAELYAVPASTQINGVLRIVNLDTSIHTYRVAHTDTSGAAANADWLAYDVEILANGIPDEISIHASAGESIRVKSSAADKVNFHLSGQKLA